MKFKSRKSYIHCLSHVLNCIVLAILRELKARTIKEALEEIDTPSNSSGIMKL
jgi:hypothetical protein